MRKSREGTRNRDAWFCLLTGLLVVALGAPQSHIVQVMKGAGERDNVGAPRLEGYYESLLEVAARNTAPRLGILSEREKPSFPPGKQSFGQADLLARRGSYLRFRLKPNLRVVWNENTFSTNAMGYRTPEVAVPKPEGVYRIVVLGSSNTMGQGVSDQEPYPRLLERWLSLRVTLPKRTIEVVNLAISSDAPTQQLDRLIRDVPRLEPDWILNDATVFDPALEIMHLYAVVQMGAAIPYDFVSEALDRAQATRADSPAEFERKLNKVMPELLAGAYWAYADCARRLNAPMTILLLPRADRHANNPNIRRLFRSLADANRLDVIDLMDAFDDLSPEQFRAADWEKHPSALGHARLFERIRESLLNRGGPPGLIFPEAG